MFIDIDLDDMFTLRDESCRTYLPICHVEGDENFDLYCRVFFQVGAQEEKGTDLSQGDFRGAY